MEGQEKKGFKTRTTHGGRYPGGSGNGKSAGWATDGGTHRGPHVELGKKAGGCGKNDTQGRYPGGSGDGNTAVCSTNSSMHHGHYTEG
jgi:hypothetical protein